MAFWDWLVKRFHPTGPRRVDPATVVQPERIEGQTDPSDENTAAPKMSDESDQPSPGVRVHNPSPGLHKKSEHPVPLRTPSPVVEPDVSIVNPLSTPSLPKTTNMKAPAATRMPTKADQRSVHHVNIGLDFGTAATKVVVRIEAPGGTVRFIAVGPAEKDATLLYPSIAAFENGAMLFGHRAEAATNADKARSFKMNLPVEAGIGREVARGRPGFASVEISAENLCILYIAWVLKDVLDQLRRHIAHSDLKVTVNGAAPMDQMHGDLRLKDLFHRVFFWGLKLAPQACQPWPLSVAHEALNEVKRVPVPVEAESPVSVLPETHAAMTSYLSHPGRESGLYATVDVGAGSTDIAFFWFHQQADQPEMCYYGTLSRYVGLDDVDERIATRTRLLVQDARNRRVKGLGLHTSNDYSVFAHEEISRIYQAYGAGFRRAYQNNLGQREWVNDDGLARYTLCLIGGGSVFEPLEQRMRLPLEILPMRRVRVIKLGVDPNLTVLRHGGDEASIAYFAGQEQPLFLLAYGLAHQSIEIPAYEPNAEFHRPTPVHQHRNHEEIYAV